MGLQECSVWCIVRLCSESKCIIPIQKHLKIDFSEEVKEEKIRSVTGALEGLVSLLFSSNPALRLPACMALNELKTVGKIMIFFLKH